MAKSILRAVGIGGVNLPNDVRVIQYLLNCVPAVQGGPLKELAIDGKADFCTNDAIRRLQRFTKGGGSGAIDPGDAVLGLLQQYDPYPFLGMPLEGYPVKWENTRVPQKLLAKLKSCDDPKYALLAKLKSCDDK